ncbi:hypothetical protein GCM10010363_16800 [Streptomyces omiyaensis]|uniref:beta-lactamase family protein n=1 Tax=Streptomyces omiyaensis TaxID=68247 RepID=UPI001993B69F|nr:beta-lactamase family protein [Streptomyces omiyaensis]GGY36787.1 hypothetical protein GCM10010363_16800 [Streptomyces omiyaensis]
MPAASTPGLADRVRPPAFQRAVAAGPLRQRTADEPVALSTAGERWYEPGTDRSSPHAGFVLLGAAPEKTSGTRPDVLPRRRVLGPPVLGETRDGFTPRIPEPVPHASTADRGTYEESTFRNPSWTTAPGAVQTTGIRDPARSAAGTGSGELPSPASRREPPARDRRAGARHREAPRGGPPRADRADPRRARAARPRGPGRPHPPFSGCPASRACPPSGRPAVAVPTTRDPGASAGHTAHVIVRRIAAAPAPGHPIPGFGWVPGHGVKL